MKLRMITIFFSLLFTFTAKGGEAIKEDRKLTVVTTLNVLSYLAGEIGGDRVDATALMNPLQDPHYVIPTPLMSQKVRNADLFIEIGLSLELWSFNVIQSSGNPNVQTTTQPGRLLASSNISVLDIPSEVSRAEGDIHPEGNPHVWLDPVNIKIMAENIANRLSMLMPGSEQYFNERLEKFKKKIDEKLFGKELLEQFGKRAGDLLTRKLKLGTLDSYLARKGLEEKLGGWLGKMKPLKGAKVIEYHKFFIYFAERFGLEIVSQVEKKPGIPPDPKTKADVIRLGKQHGVKIIVTTNYLPIEAAEYVANAIGADVVVTYVDVGGSDKISTYTDMIDYMVDKLVSSKP